MSSLLTLESSGKHIYIHIYTYMSVCIYNYMYIHVCIYMYIYVYMSIYVYICIYIYVRIRDTSIYPYVSGV